MYSLIKKYLQIVFVFFFIISIVHAQEHGKISLEEIFLGHEFGQKTTYSLKSMRDGEHFTILDKYNYIIRFKYSTGDRMDTIFSTAGLNKKISYGISDYEFNDSESKILLVTSRQKIYRYSFSADYYIYNLSDQSLQPLCMDGRQEIATFSPDGNFVAFVRNNNLFYRDLTAGKTHQITHDGKKNEIINGKPDWVYEEEFDFRKAFSWSPDGKKIAFYRFDESEVRQFNIIKYDSLYPTIYSYKYPKAGEDNSKVSIHVYDINTGITQIMDIGENEDQYIPRIMWTQDPEKLCIVRLNRLQNKIDIMIADASTGKSKIIYTEKNKYFISDISDDYITFIDSSNQFIIKSETDGYMHLYLYDIRGNLINQVTMGEWDVDKFFGFDPDKGLLYYTSSEVSPLERHVYSIKPDGSDKNKLTNKPGTNKALFSNGFKYFINYHSTADSPNYISVHNSSGELLRVLEDNAALKDKIRSYVFVKKEFIKVPVSEGLELNGYIMKPANFDESRKYPLLMFAYGGPGSQRVKDSWQSRLPWFQMLVQSGYIIACIDNRGTDARGEEFRKCTYMQLGILETEDLIKSAEYLGGFPYIDSSRIGIFGWSYGGYLALFCLAQGAHIFSMAIAVAPVTHWRFYDTIYTERYMRTPEENRKGYEQSSPLNIIDKIKGDLLLIHSTADDNVHLQNSMELIKKLVENNIQFEMQFYPDKDHSIRGGYTSYHLYKRMTDFILSTL
jgi:dipeptidyl-peptidase-4